MPTPTTSKRLPTRKSRRWTTDIKAQRKALRANSALTVGEKVEAQRAIKKLEGRRDELMLAKFERKKAIRREVEDILD